MEVKVSEVAYTVKIIFLLKIIIVQDKSDFVIFLFKKVRAKFHTCCSEISGIALNCHSV